MNTLVLDFCRRPEWRFRPISINPRTLCATFALIGILAVAQPTSAATILVDANGHLIGATGVSVNGTLYDVSFGDGSCVTVYDGCDANTDFPFTTQTAATSASQALLNQVFLDGPAGLFDTVPSLTAGCTFGADTNCGVATPWSLYYDPNNNPWFNSSLAQNGVLFDSVQGFGTTVGVDLNNWSEYAFADWSPAASAVPEPASMVLLGTGLLGAGARRWRQKRA